ncbi:MAG: aldo/keto reductase [Candidatus Dormibacteria bacterium]
MTYRQLGDSGLMVSTVGLGCNNFGRRLDQAASVRVIHAALDAGITLLDTADIYGDDGQSELFVGAALKDRRERAVLATKFAMPMGDGVEGPYNHGGSRHYLRRAVEASLRRLATDHIDLYQMHRPYPSSPIEETLATLDDLVREGKLLYIGSSNLSGWQIADADWIARTRHLERFISAQNHYSLVERGVEKEVIPACRRFGVGMLPYFPLADGLLTGKYHRGEQAQEGSRLAGGHARSEYRFSDRNWAILEGLEGFARERSISLLDVAFGGLAAQAQVASVIAGATRVEQVEANARTVEWTPTSEDLAELDRISPPPAAEGSD